jgi:predicted double-glycine peptidase
MIKFLIIIITSSIMLHPSLAGASDGKWDPAPTTTVRLKTPFGGYITKKVISAREMKFKDIVPQNHDFSCGSGALATILKYVYSVDEVKEEEIAKEMIEKGDQQKIREKGFSLLDMKNYAERHGFQAAGYKVKSENLHKLKIPSIVLLNTGGYKHFVVLKGIEDQKAYFADPAIGNRSVPFSDFLPTWDEVVFVVYKKTDNDLSLPLNETLRPPVSNVLNLHDLGMRNYNRSPGEF